VFPVVGFDGELTGVVLASQFEDIPASDRARPRVDKVALEVPPAYQAVPGDPAAPWPAAPHSVVRSPRWSWPTAG
jgi:CBS domain-containing protein